MLEFLERLSIGSCILFFLVSVSLIFGSTFYVGVFSVLLGISVSNITPKGLNDFLQK